MTDTNRSCGLIACFLTSVWLANCSNCRLYVVFSEGAWRSLIVLMLVSGGLAGFNSMTVVQVQVFGGNTAVVRPVPIPNTAVKRCMADGSGCIASARVGSRQSFNKSPDRVRAFCFLPSDLRTFSASPFPSSRDILLHFIFSSRRNNATA